MLHPCMKGRRADLKRNIYNIKHLPDTERQTHLLIIIRRWDKHSRKIQRPNSQDIRRTWRYETMSLNCCCGGETKD